MVNNFKSDKQRKAVMAKLRKGSSRSDTQPTILGRIKGAEKKVQEGLRRRFKPTAEELAKARGARLQREAQSLKEERRRVKQLELEAGVESERERIRTREREARTRLSEIDRARRERTLAGRAVITGRKLAVTGLKKLAEPAPTPRRRKRRKAPVEETGFFGI